MSEAVVFDVPDGAGGVIQRSNDPYWNAQQLLDSRPKGKPADEDDDLPDEIDSLNAAQLKEKAAELGVDIKGLKKVGQVRTALREAIAALENEKEDSDDVVTSDTDKGE